jgi:hypothetical protein
MVRRNAALVIMGSESAAASAGLLAAIDPTVPSRLIMSTARERLTSRVNRGSIGPVNQESNMQKAVRKYLKALESGNAAAAGELFTKDGWVQSPFLGRLPVRDFVTTVASASGDSKLTVYDVLVSAEGHTRAVAYYLYDWRLKDGSRVAFDCADVFNFDPESGHIASIVLVYDTHLVRDVVRNKYPGGAR